MRNVIQPPSTVILPELKNYTVSGGKGRTFRLHAKGLVLQRLQELTRNIETPWQDVPQATYEGSLLWLKWALELQSGSFANVNTRVTKPRL